MPTTLVLAGLVLLVAAGLLLRHHHRWTAWSAPVVRSSGRITQTRWCKDRACNRHQIKDVRR